MAERRYNITRMLQGLKKLTLFLLFLCLYVIGSIPSDTPWHKAFQSTLTAVMVIEGDKTTVTLTKQGLSSDKAHVLLIPVSHGLVLKQIGHAPFDVIRKLDEITGLHFVEETDPSPCDRSRKKRFESKSKSVEMNEVSTGLPYLDVYTIKPKEMKKELAYLKSKGFVFPGISKGQMDRLISGTKGLMVVKYPYSLVASTTIALGPVQITYSSPEPVLPVNLLQLNLSSNEGIKLFVVSENSRKTIGNYPVTKVPNGMSVPAFVEDMAMPFYEALLSTQRRHRKTNAFFMEYAGNLFEQQSKGIQEEFEPLGAGWVKENKEKDDKLRGDGQFYVTRLFGKYNKDFFKKELKFKATTTRDKVELRYAIRKPHLGKKECEQLKNYEKFTLVRKRQEASTLESLTGWSRQWIFAKMGIEEVEEEQEREFEKEKALTL